MIFFPPSPPKPLPLEVCEEADRRAFVRDYVISAVRGTGIIGETSVKRVVSCADSAWQAMRGLERR